MDDRVALRSGGRSFHFLLASITCLASLLWSAATAEAVSPWPELADLEISSGRTASTSVDGSTEAVAAWTHFERSTDSQWQVTWNDATGLPHRGIPARYDVAVTSGELIPGLSEDARIAGLDANSIDRMSRTVYAQLRTTFPALPGADELQVFVIERRGGVWWVIYEQLLDGIAVEGAWFSVRFSDEGTLLFFTNTLIPNPSAGGAVLLDTGMAQARAQQELSRDGLSAGALSASTQTGVLVAARNEDHAITKAGPILGDHLVYLPVVSEDGTTIALHLSQVVRTDVSEPPARFVTYVDAITGDIHKRTNEFHYADYAAHSDAEIHLATPTDPFVTRDLEDLRITVAGIGEDFTDADGNILLPSPDGLPRMLSSVLTGRWCRIDDAGGPEPLFEVSATPDVLEEVHWDAGNSEAAERDAFYHVGVIHAWQKNVDPSFLSMDYEMRTRVNVSGSCNAFWDGSGINFFRAGGSCPNIAEIADVVYHEYGHGTNQFAYAPGGLSGAQHEGMGDYQAATITNQPLIGRGFTGPGTFLRTCDNNRVWPAPECGGSVHCVGEVIAAALWHMRENLVDRLGLAAGMELADQLFHFARFGRDNTFDGYYFDLLAVADDNGTLLDGTPFSPQIIQAFDRHNIGPGWTLDILHAPLADAENPTGTYAVTAVFAAHADLIEESLKVFYTAVPEAGAAAGGGFTELAMTATGGIREYTALIPAQPLGTDVSYYISGEADTLGLNATNPIDAPVGLHTFRVGIDVTPPTVDHDPLADKSFAIWPVAIRADASDNLGVASVEVLWDLNGSPQTPLLLVESEVEGSYAGAFVGLVDEGDLIDYRVRVTDGAASANTAFDPPAGSHSFSIIHNFEDEMENGAQDWNHAIGSDGFVDQWHLSTQRNFTSGGATSWKFGSTGGGNYSDSADGVLVAPPIALGSDATMSFRHWMDAELQSSTTAWDGGLVEISTNGGVDWNPLDPIGGYSHTIIDNAASPFPAGYPCWSGNINWELVEFDLAAFANTTVQIRWRFGTDGAATEEGWYIDSLVLDPAGETSDAPDTVALPSETRLFGASPNPVVRTGNTQIRFAIREAVENGTIDIVDVSGRKISRLLDGRIEAGFHSMEWDGRNAQGRTVGNGVYFIRLRADDLILTEKLLVVR